LLEVGKELEGDKSLKGFRQKREMGDRPIILTSIWILYRISDVIAHDSIEVIAFKISFL